MLIKRLFTIVSLCLCFQTLHAQVTSADTLINKIFAALKNKDEKAFLALYPNRQQMSKLMNTLAENLIAEMKKEKKPTERTGNATNFDSLMVAEFRNMASPEELARMETKHAKDFRKIIAKGEEQGINWANTKLVNYTYDSVTLSDEAMLKMFGSREFKNMKGVIHFTSGDSAFKMSFDDVIYIPDEKGWFGVKLRRLVREGETLVYDDETTTETRDITLESIVDEELPPPPPPPSKAKTKKTSAKTKIKSKTKS